MRFAPLLVLIPLVIRFIAMPRHLIFEQNHYHHSQSFRNVESNFLKSHKIIETYFPIKSRTSCMLETFNESLSSPGAALRSCKYEYLCYDIFRKTLVLFPSINHYRVLSMVHSSIYLSSLSKPVVASTTSALTEDLTFARPFYSKFRKNDKHYLIIDELKDSLWIPLKISDAFQSVLWEIYFPLYSLTEILFLTSKNFHIFLLNNSNITLKRIHDFSEEWQLPKLKVISLPPNFKFDDANANQYLCFTHAAMGIGGLSNNRIPKRNDAAMDHHKPPEQMHRGRTIQNFRNHIVQLMNISVEGSISFDLVYSTPVSWITIINNITNFLKKELIQSMPLRDQVSLILQTKMLLIASNEDKTVALFLPPKAHLIIIGPPNLDWDFWTNCIWIQVHSVRANVSKALAYIIDEVMHDKLLEHSSFENRNDNIVRLNYYHNLSLINQTPPITRIHCVAEKLFPNQHGAPHFRSCLFRNLCYDLRKKEFIIFPSPAYLRLLTTQTYLLKHGNYFSTISQPLFLSPSLKSRTNMKHGNFRIHTDVNSDSMHYRLFGIWISVNSVRSCNPGHLIWDYWAPIFELKNRFNISTTDLLLTYGKNREKCKLSIRKSIEQLFGVSEAMLPAMKLQILNPGSNYLCSDYSVSGYGWLNDHGFSSHGWVDDDMNYPMNLHRGPEFSLLRSFLLKNVNLPDAYQARAPFILLFSLESSKDMRRCLGFKDEIQIAKQLERRSNGLISVYSFHHQNSTVRKQLDLSSKASIFITASGGGSFPAFFLPRGSVLIIYGDREMHLDSDLYNNFGQITVHWMSLRYKSKDTSIFFHLLCDEIEKLLLSIKNDAVFDCGHFVA